MYFRCVYEYAEFEEYLKNQDLAEGDSYKDWIGYKSLTVMLPDSLGDLKRTRNPYIKGIENFYNLERKFNLIDNTVKFIMKIPEKFSVLLKLIPEVQPQSKFITVQMREIYNPFNGFIETSVF